MSGRERKDKWGKPTAWKTYAAMRREILRNHLRTVGQAVRNRAHTRIDEAKDATLIQVLDRPALPERKSKPKRSLIVLIFSLSAVLLVIFLAFVLDAMEKSEADPQHAERLARLKTYLRLGRSAS